MRVAICDDDPVWRQKAVEILEEYKAAANVALEISTYDNGETMLAEPQSVDVLFLDIEMGEQNGISVAAEVNQKWKNCSIVYLTDHISYAVDVYDTRHAYYVLKNQFAERIEVVFEKIFHEKAQQNTILTFQLADGNIIQIPPKNILYFERDRRITRIIAMKNNESVIYEIKDKINTIEAMLPALDFARCHNSYIVYLPAVQEITKTSIVMKNGDTIDISRQYQSRMRERFLAWARLQ